MNPPSLAPAAALLLVLHGSGWAGPVAAGEAAAGAPVAAGLASPTLEPAASGAAASVLVAEIIQDADAGAESVESPRGMRRASARAVLAPTAAPTRTQAPGDDDPWGVREAGKAALQWVKDSVPWLRSDEDARDAPRAVTSDQADWSASPLEGGALGAARGVNTHLPAARAAVTDPLTTVGYGEASQQQPKHANAEPNIVRVIIDTIREVLEHPMTWLVLALVAVGAIAVRKLDRRPTE